MSKARFISGSILWHVVAMSFTGSAALVSVFLVDFIDIYFISRLNNPEITAAVGFAHSAVFFVRSVGLALSIATGVLVARNIGAGERETASRFATHATIFSLVIICVFSVIFMYFAREILQVIGAKGETLNYATNYLRINLIATNFLTLGFCGGQTLRALSEGALSMRVSILAALVNLFFDPLCIFTLELGVYGAALASLIAQLTLTIYAWYLLYRRFSMVNFLYFSYLFKDIKPILAIAIPTVLTNLAAPTIAAFAAHQMASFGDVAMSAYVVVIRFFPLSAAILFALSGAVAPIVGQNAGAKLYSRVRSTLISAFCFNWFVCALITFLLFLLRDYLIILFKLKDESATLFLFFCSGITLLMGFDGMLFFTIAAFNNLTHPFYSMITNFSRIIFGAFPFIFLGKKLFGAKGVLLGFMSNSLIVSSVAFFILFKLVKRYENNS